MKEAGTSHGIPGRPSLKSGILRNVNGHLKNVRRERMKNPWQEFRDDPTGFSRSFLLLVGMLMLCACSIGVYRSIIAKTEHANLFTYVAMIVTFVIGAYAIISAFSKNADLVATFADGCSTHEAAILLLVAAWPLQLVLKGYWKRFPRQTDDISE